MLRLLKFASLFLGTALLIFLLIFGLSRDVFRTVFDNRAAIAEGSEWVEKTYSLYGLTEYIAEHPQYVSIASLTPGDPSGELRYRDREPRAMGMLSSLFLLSAYAEAIETGEIDAAEKVSWREIERFQLPRIGETELREARRLAQRGGALDGERIAISALLELLPRSGSYALHDFLLHRFGKERFSDRFGRLGLQSTDLPLPYSGILLTLAPSLQQIEARDILDYWQGEGSPGWSDEVWANTLSYAFGDGRERWEERLRGERLGLDFQQQRDLLELFPKTTADEIAVYLSRLLNGELLPPEAGSRVGDWLRYPSGESILRRHFDDYGALYDSRLGLLNGVDFGTPSGDAAPRVQAVLFDRMQIAVWFHMSSNHMHQDFQQRLIWDSELIETTRRAIRNRTL